ncbi:DUF1800 domain-containing protein [Vibrio sp. Isolate24]|uniref:DUF1800 domain-containing protein n=1 Tax=Vibrio sp. Isolate24 TaxID=2908534 RepID=UPI001EFDFC79|nr:DUF1800 domain-containing protein [Vibrio sp. Isolate24]MCG9680193.1 DUF1800 domain-containing protein [Vibrio sp. Isolate24]
MNYYPNEQILAEQRFGFGPQLGRPTSPLVHQLEGVSYLHPSIQALPSTKEILTQLGESQAQRAKVKNDEVKKRELQEQLQAFYRQHYRQQIEARHQQSIHTPYGFQERLIQFWSNHFAISVDNRRLMPLASKIENDVVRQHWSGNFSDMLMGVSKHPAILMYLDNQASTGPNSKLGKRRGKGLNENLAREILELHTLGVDSSYTQQDVIELAKAISGWSIKLKSPDVGFRFVPSMHEPGAVKVMGRTYAQKGIEQGEACLQALALHPDTAQHLATKLCQHFFGRSYPELEAAMANAYLKSAGELRPVYQVLIESEPAGSAEPMRFRTPKEWLFAVLRSAQISISDKQAMNVLNVLGQPAFNPGSPAGWPDRDKDYNSPSALTQRLQVANMLAAKAVKQAKASNIQPQKMVDDVISQLYGAYLDEHTQLVLSKTKNPMMQLSLFWLSPQFQYR